MLSAVGLASTFLAVTGDRFHDFKLKPQFLAATDHRQVELPKLAREAKGRPMLIQVDNEFEAERPPQIRQSDVGVDGLEFNLCVERKRSSLGHKASERVTVEMISMRRIRGPIRIGIVRRDDFDPAAGPGDAMKFRNKRHHIRYVFNHMAADDFIELIVGEGIGQYPQIMNDICVATRIRIDTDSPRVFVLATADVEDLLSQRVWLWG